MEFSKPVKVPIIKGEQAKTILKIFLTEK